MSPVSAAEEEEREFLLAFIFSLSLGFPFYFFFSFVAIFSHVGHVYKMRRVLSIFITQTPQHPRTPPPCHTVVENRLLLEFCSFFLCGKFFIKKCHVVWFRLLSPCESPLNDRFVIMRHLRNFYMNSLNDLTFERASAPILMRCELLRR